MNGAGKIRKAIKLKKGEYQYLSQISHCLPYNYESNLNCMVKRCRGHLIPYDVRSADILLYCNVCEKIYFGHNYKITLCD